MRPSRHRLSERGFSMVELLVAMLIGLIGMIIIFQVFEVSESIKRSTTSGGDAQQNGAIALYSIERDFKNAGMGFNDTTFAGCDIVGYDNKRATPDFPPAGVTMKLAPVFITSGAATTAPDQISVLYGSQPQAVGSVPLFSDMDATKNGADDLIVTNPFGYNLGDVFILDQPATTKKCAVMEVTAITGSNQVSHNPSPNYLYAAASRTPRFNKAGGLGVVYQGTGTANVSRAFNALVPVPWANLIAVRVAVVSRSALPEKPSSGKLSDPCDATLSEPQWTGTPWANAPLSYKTRLDVSSTVPAPDSWTCYRYRVFETTIPLRNWIWKAS